MLFFYIRHGDPFYDPNELTPLGRRQAEALAKRIALYGVDEIYTSTSNRAYETAIPTYEILKKELKSEPKQLDFCNEKHAWAQMTVKREGRSYWIWDDPETRNIFCESSVLERGHKWYEDPRLADYRAGIERIYDGADEFFASLGYEHIRYTGRYKAIQPNDKRVAMFAHQGFGLAFLSAILDIPYPMLSNHIDLSHTGMTVIEFAERDGYSIPKMLTMSSDSHLYREGLPTNYNNRIRF